MTTTDKAQPQADAGEEKIASVTELVPRDGALEITKGQQWWTRAQRAALESIGLRDTPDADRMAFLHLCQATGLDPFRREIYLIGRKDRKAPGGVKWTAQTGIDGFRHIAERSGEFRGRSQPQWCGEDGVWKDVWFAEEPPVAAKVIVKRLIDTEVVEFPVVAMYREFCPMVDEYDGPQGNRQKTGVQVPSGLWGKMPAHMLAKCAEAFAIRSAFPRQAGGVYLHEEMEKADQQAREEEQREQAQKRRQAREEARSEGAARPWAAREGVLLGETPGEPQGPVQADAQVGAEPDPDAETVEAEIVEPVDRDALMAELAEQADLFGMKIDSMCRRWIAQHRKNIEAATDEELLALVRERRESAARKRAEKQAEQPVETPAAEPETPAETSDEDTGASGPDDPFEGV